MIGRRLRFWLGRWYGGGGVDGFSESGRYGDAEGEYIGSSKDGFGDRS